MLELEVGDVDGGDLSFDTPFLQFNTKKIIYMCKTSKKNSI